MKQACSGLTLQFDHKNCETLITNYSNRNKLDASHGVNPETEHWSSFECVFKIFSSCMFFNNNRIQASKDNISQHPRW